MIKKFIKEWHEKKNKIKKVFEESHPQSYKSVVEFLFKEIISGFNVENLVEINHGDYQGTQIYIIPEQTYQPDTKNYVWFDNYYGSCSGCDLLESIRGYGSGKPDEQQVLDYMDMALHMVEKIKWLVPREED